MYNRTSWRQRSNLTSLAHLSTEVLKHLMARFGSKVTTVTLWIVRASPLASGCVRCHKFGSLSLSTVDTLCVRKVQNTCIGIRKFTLKAYGKFLLRKKKKNLYSWRIRCFLGNTVSVTAVVLKHAINNNSSIFVLGPAFCYASNMCFWGGGIFTKKIVRVENLTNHYV